MGGRELVDETLPFQRLSRDIYGKLVSSLHHPAESDVAELTCWRKCGQLQEPQSSAVRIHWTPCGRKGGTRRHLHACDQGRRFESLGQVHHG